MQEAIGRRRNVAENALIRSIRAGRVGDHIKKVEDQFAIRRDAENALSLAAGLGADEVGQSGLCEMQVQLGEQLTKAGIKNVYFESPGTAHEWLTWRRCLNDFAPRLFK